MIVSIIGDTHAPAMLKDYDKFCRDTFDYWCADRVVHAGDLLDSHSISFHQKVVGLKDPIKERELALTGVQKLVEMFPAVDLLIGNHDDLLRRQMEANGLDPNSLRPFEEYWGLPKSWKVHPRFTDLRIDGVLYRHGDKGSAGRYAMANQSKDNMASIVLGHHHSLGGVYWFRNPNTTTFGLSVGCGVDKEHPAMVYAAKSDKEPMIGCGIVVNGEEPHFIPAKLSKTGKIRARYGR